MTDIYLVRHGETDWNRVRRFQGHIDIPLNARGAAQAACIATRLADAGINAVYSSDLERAQATARPLANRLGLAVQTDTAWRERNYGLFEGLRIDEIKKRHTAEYARWQERDPDYALPGGESLRAFSARILNSLRDVATRHFGQNVLVTTHGGALDVVWRAAHGLPLDHARACPIPNCAVNLIRFDGTSFATVVWADEAHLGALNEIPT